MSELIPTEAQEQKVLVQYLRLKKIPHFRVPNETYTKSWKQKSNNKALGVQSGVPDLFVLLHLPIQGIRVWQWHGFEMKRKKGGVLSAKQKEWIELLTKTGIPTYVFKGADEAIKFIENTEGK